jgi:uncharacterized protein
LKKRVVPVLKWIGWVLLVQFILINISASLYAYKLTHFYNNVDPHASANSNVFSKSWKLFTGPKYPRPVIEERPVFPYDTVTFKTKRGITIDGWYARPDSFSKGTVILFHGISVSKSILLDEANEFRYQGYNILMVDFRAHGNSKGRTTTIGVKEAEEIKLAYDFISSKGERNIYLYGSSMGAVAIAKAISDHKLQPSGVILDMPFESLQLYLEAKARLLGFPKQPFAFLTTFWIGIEKGFNGFRHKTSRYVRDMNCPVLMEWGARDRFVLRGATDRIFNAIASSNKKLLIYENSAHESFLRKEPQKWRMEIENFLEVNRK